jgi:hypothetical protein
MKELEFITLDKKEKEKRSRIASKTLLRIFQVDQKFMSIICIPLQ